MATTAYHDVPVRPFPLDVSQETERVIGEAQVVIERNEGSVEVFLKIPKGSPLYDAFVSDTEVLQELWLDGMFERHG